MILRFLLATALFISTPLSLMADFTVSFSNTNFQSGTPGQYFDVFVLPTNPANSIVTNGLTMDFTFTNAASGSWVSPTASSTLANPGFQFANSTIQNFDGYNSGVIGGFTAVISPTASPSTNIAIARMFVDTQNLAPGTYDFDYSIELDGTSQSGGASTLSSLGSGAITVSAVPEPTSMALLGLMTVGGVAYRKLRKAKKNPAVG